MIRLLILMTMVSTTAFSQAAPGSILGVTPTGRIDPDVIYEMADPLFEHWGVPGLPRAVDTYNIYYATRDVAGSAARILAQVFIPVFEGEAAGTSENPVRRPLLVFGSGTTGIGDQCAPSLERPIARRWGHYRANMLAYASQGIITIFPDYLGFNDTTRPQRYFSKVAEAHTMLDAARAVNSFLANREAPVRPSDHLFTSGYSQGGHAAFAAADLRQEYAPELPLTGVIGFAATTDVETLFREGPYYAPNIIYNYLDMYGPEEIAPEDYFLEQWASSLTYDVPRLCVDEFQYYYPYDGTELYTPEFYEALYARDLESDFPELARRLSENATGLSGHGFPALVIQGNQDIIITTPSQTEFVEALEAAGSEVEYIAMDGVRHRHTRPAGFRDSVRWIKERSGLAEELAELE